jgi:hypothetical protein
VEFFVLEDEIANPGDWRATVVGQMPVVVARNGEGEIAAFENRGAHRGALICLDNADRDALICLEQRRPRRQRFSVRLTRITWSFSTPCRNISAANSIPRRWHACDLRWNRQSLLTVPSRKRRSTHPAVEDGR